MREQLLQAARQHGTPLFVYDMEQIHRNLQVIQDAFGPKTQIHFACKALENAYVLKRLKEWGCGIDAVSQEELEISLRCGFSPDDINFTPSGAHLNEYKWAIEHGINVHVDNLEILQLLGEYKNGVALSLRFNPQVRTGGHAHLQVGADDSKFGLYPEEMEKVSELIEQYHIDVKRIHVHVGSDVKTVDDFILCYKQAFDYAEGYADSVDVIDLGGGFGVKYFPEDKELDMARLGLEVNKLRATYEAKVGKSVELMLEPGKSIVGNAGFFLMEVTMVKELIGNKIAYVNSGFNHMIRPMYYGARHVFENLSNPMAPLSNYKLVGYLCETDTFSESVDLPTVKRGDIIAMQNGGAYSMSMASNYNSRRRPAEVALENGDLKLIRRRETLEDLLSTLVEE